MMIRNIHLFKMSKISKIFEKKEVLRDWYDDGGDGRKCFFFWMRAPFIQGFVTELWHTFLFSDSVDWGYFYIFTLFILREEKIKTRWIAPVLDFVLFLQMIQLIWFMMLFLDFSTFCIHHFFPIHCTLTKNDEKNSSRFFLIIFQQANK